MSVEENREKLKALRAAAKDSRRALEDFEQSLGFHSGYYESAGEAYETEVYKERGMTERDALVATHGESHGLRLHEALLREREAKRDYGDLFSIEN